MPSVRNLVWLLAIGCLAFVLFAFTILGLVGEALIVLALAGLAYRGVRVTLHRLGPD
jgi:hypothetical protein